MLRANKALVLALAAVTAGFVFGVVRLFQLRFEAGDIYPPYSTLRADPLGTKAFFESLQSLAGRTAERHLRGLYRLRPGRDATLFILGVDASSMENVEESDFTELERFMHEGGRVVFSFVPANTKPWRADASESKGEQEREARKGKGQTNDSERKRPELRKGRRPVNEEDEELGAPKRVSVADRWGVDLAYEDLPRDEVGGYQTVEVFHTSRVGPLPEKLPWHTALFFKPSATNWSAIYTRNTHVVVTERGFGKKGSVVLCADSYLVSNEALRQERHTAVLAWLVGDNRAIVFDEAHLNVRDDPGVAALIRKYRLHGLVAGLALLAGLFVWQNALSFIPARDEDRSAGSDDPVLGKDSAAGFVNLLRRSISPSELLPVCFNEWKKSCTRGRPDLQQRVDRIGAVVSEEAGKPTRERDPVGTYRRISELLADRK